MQKSKIFLATGALVLAISAVFATKANKKFKQVSTGYGAATLGEYAVITNQAVFTTKGSSTAAVYAQLTTINGHVLVSAQELKTQSGGTGNPVLFK